MAGLYTYRTALDELQTLLAEGRLSKASYLVTKRAINNQVFKHLKDRFKTEPSEVLYAEVDATGFHSVERAVREFYGQ